MQDPQPKITMLPQGFVPVDSSNLKAVGWFNPHGEPLITIQFKDDKTHLNPSMGQFCAVLHESATQGNLEVIFNNGSRWQYRGVPKEVVTALLTAESVGKTYNALIKGNEAYESHQIPITEQEG